MQNEDDQNRFDDVQNRLALKKSFLNFTLRHFITLYNLEIPNEMKEQKKFGVKILQYIKDREKENNFIFANFLRYQMPLLIINGKIKEKKLYFFNL